MYTFNSPLSEFQRVMDLMDRTFGQWIGEGGNRTTEAAHHTLPIDVWQKGAELFVRAAVPGVAPEELEIQFQDGMLTIAGETKRAVQSDNDARVWRREYTHGKFSRTVRLPENVIDEKIEAAFDNGFVTITIPLMVQERKSLKIPVKAIGQHDTKALEANSKDQA